MMRKKPIKIMVIIPAFNEAKRIKKTLLALKNSKLPVIVVDDGSTDKTLEISRPLVWKVIKHSSNLGKGAALKTGCELAFKEGAQAVIMMDADGQHSFNDLPKFSQTINSGSYDIVFGSRDIRQGVPFLRYLGNRVAPLVIFSLFGIYVSDLICGFRAFTKEAYQKIDWKSRGYNVETEMVIKTGKHKLRFCEIPIDTIYHDKYKGVTMIDAFSILGSVLKWRLSK